MSLKDLANIEKEMKRDNKCKTVIGFIVGIIILLGLIGIVLLKD